MRGISSANKKKMVTVPVIDVQNIGIIVFLFFGGMSSTQFGWALLHSSLSKESEEICALFRSFEAEAEYLSMKALGRLFEIGNHSYCLRKFPV